MKILGIVSCYDIVTNELLLRTVLSSPFRLETQRNARFYYSNLVLHQKVKNHERVKLELSDIN